MKRQGYNTSEIAEQFNVSKKLVNYVTQGIKPKRSLKPIKVEKFIHQNSNKRKPRKVKAEPITLEQTHMQKGNAKVLPNQKVFANREHGLQRAIPLHDNKNTIKFVKADDPRTAEQIRQDWYAQQDRLIAELKGKRKTA